MGISPAERPEDPDETVPWASWRLVTRDYFRTIGVPLLRGRVFTERDRIGEPWRAVISKTLAEHLWPGEDPIGRHALLWSGQEDDRAEIIGVVGDMRERGLDQDPAPIVYLPYYGAGWSPVNFVVHTAGDPRGVVPILRSVLADIDPTLPLGNVESMDEIVDDSVAGRRFNMLMLAIFAAVALVLALAGIYGVQAYTVTRRTSEIGVRVALGASRRRVIGLIVGGGMRPTLAGIGLGLAGALGLSRLMSALLFGVTPTDPATYVGVGLLLATTALLSCTLPGLRALRVDPVTALREE